MSGLPSPCVRNCCLHPETDVCLGCFRSLEEILVWHSSNDLLRQEILDRARQRREEDEATRVARQQGAGSG